jgi:hypothetical protein
VEEYKIKGIAIEKGIRITHIICVHDIILLCRGYMTEWGMFKEALDFLAMQLERFTVLKSHNFWK